MKRKFAASMALLIVVVTTAACGGFGLWETVECTPDFYGLTTKLPPSAEVLEQRCRTAFNPDYRVVFTMDAADLEVFQAEAPVVEWATDASGLLHFEAEAGRATALLAGRFINGAIAVEALVDMSNADVYTVYYQATFVD